MLQTTSASQPAQANPPGPLATRRVDPAHPPNRPDFAESGDGAADERLATPQTPASAKLDVQQLEHYAEQLAEFLRLKQRDLDRREAQLNAQLGQCEQAERAGRLQLEDRRQALGERELQIARREAELTRRTAALAAAEVAAEQAAASAKQLDDRRSAELDVCEQRFAERQQHLGAQLERLKDAEQRLQSSQQKWQQQITCEHQQLLAQRAELLQQQRRLLQNLERHRAALDQSTSRVAAAPPPPSAELESPPAPPATEEKTAPTEPSHDNRPSPSVNELQRSLSEQLTEINRRARWLEQEREMWLAQRTVEERQFNERSIAERARLDEREKRVQKQRQALGRLQRLLSGARREALKIHGETLEMRLAIEQVWSNLSALADPADVTRTMARLRSELEAHYSVERQEIQQLLAKIHLAAQQLHERQRQLETSRAEWQTWITAQRKHLETRTEQLAARQRQLDAQQARLRRLDLGKVGLWPGHCCPGSNNPRSTDKNVRATTDQLRNR